MHEHIISPSLQTCGSAQCAHLALALLARNTAFLTCRSHTLPTVLCILTISAATSAPFSSGRRSLLLFCTSTGIPSLSFPSHAILSPVWPITVLCIQAATGRIEAPCDGYVEWRRPCLDLSLSRLQCQRCDQSTTAANAPAASADVSPSACTVVLSFFCCSARRSMANTFPKMPHLLLMQ